MALLGALWGHLGGHFLLKSRRKGGQDAIRTLLDYFFPLPGSSQTYFFGPLKPSRGPPHAIFELSGGGSGRYTLRDAHLGPLWGPSGAYFG